MTLCFVLGIIAQRTLNLPLGPLILFCLFALMFCFIGFSISKVFKVGFLLLVLLTGMALYSFELSSPERGGRMGPKKNDTGIIGCLRERFRQTTLKMLPPPYSDLLGSIVLGTSVSPPPDDMIEAHRKVGTIHILVASGQQLAILVGCTMAISRFLGLPGRLGASAATLFALIFSFIAGGGPSILRAFVMSEAALAAGSLGRENNPISALSFSAFALLIFKPSTLFNIGFQLSFAATFALLGLAPILEDALSGKMPKALASLSSISLAPYLVTMPIIAYNFSQFSVLAVFANALVLPWIEVVVVIGFAALVLGALYMPIAYVFSGALLLLLSVLDLIVRAAASLPFSNLNIGQVSLPLVAGYYIILFRVISMIKNKKPFVLTGSKLLIASLAMISVLFWQMALTSGFGSSPNMLQITVINVGQGDSILIEAPSGKSILIDGGVKSAGKYTVLPFIQKKGKNILDYVVLSHPHEDHLGGLNPILNSVKVGTLIDSGQPHTSAAYINFLKQIGSKKIKYSIARAGQTIDLGGGALMFILWPKDKFLTGTQSDLNNNSVVIKLVYNKFSALFPGDLGGAGEAELLKTGQDLKSDLLKIGHHGSPTSATQGFLDSVDPKIAVISVGENKYGHPSSKTMERLEKRGVKIYRTDLDGTVTVRTDGERYFVEARK